MVDVTMSQSADIRALVMTLAESCPSLRVSVCNLGAVRVNGQAVEFFQAPSITEVDLGEIRAKKFFPIETEELQAERALAYRGRKARWKR